MKFASVIVPVLVTVGACASSSFTLPKRVIRWKQHSLRRPLRREQLPRNQLDESRKHKIRNDDANEAARTKAKTDAPKEGSQGHPQNTQPPQNQDDAAAMTKHHKNPLNCLCFYTIMCIFYVNLTLNAMQRFVSTIFL